jgi:hypothetical protein
MQAWIALAGKHSVPRCRRVMTEAGSTVPRVEGQDEDGKVQACAEHAADAGKDLVDGLGCTCGKCDVREDGEGGRDVPRKPKSVDTYRCVTLRSKGSPKCTGAGRLRW